ncbi:MAG: YcbK family protein [Steroidobacteraceae bacterium]
MQRCTRRQFTTLAASLGVAAVSARSAFATIATALPGEQRLQLLNVHTGEECHFCFARDGSYDTAGLRGLAHFLRDFRTGEEHEIDPRLYELLHSLAVACEREPRFEVISGYRSAATNAMLGARSTGVAKQSLHMSGQAIDIRLKDASIEKVRDIALGFQLGGVGYYRRSNFVHLDTGRVRSWAG